MIEETQEQKGPGRPPKFNSPEELEEKLSQFFLKCVSNEVMPTKGNLAIELHTTRETLGDYEEKPEYSYTIKRAYAMIEDAWVQRLAGNNVAGSIFYLKNAFKKDWKDRTETDVTSNGLSIQFAPQFKKDEGPNEGND